MAKVVYEWMFILDANRYGRDPGALSGRLEKHLTDAGGNLLVSRLWEERRLAYPIRNQRKGVYWLTYVELDPNALVELSRQLQIDEGILRHLPVKVHPSLVEAIVAHARGETTAEDSEEAAESTEAAAPAETAS